MSACWAALLVVASSTAAPAAEPQSAQRLFTQAEHYYLLGNFERALELFSDAYASAPLPELLFNIAQCHMELGDYRRAVYFYERFLQLAPPRQARELASERLAQARQSLHANQLGDALPPPQLATPFYRQRWFWGVALAVALAATGSAAYFTASSFGNSPDTTLGRVDRR